MAYSRAIGKVRSPSPLRQEIARAEASDDEAGNRRASTDSDVQRRLAAQRVFGRPPPPPPRVAPAEEGSLWMFEQSEEVQEQHIEYSVDLLDAAEGLWEIEEAKLGALESPAKQGAPRRTVEDLPMPKGPRTAGSSRQQPPAPAPTSPRKVSDPKPLTFNARPLPALPPATVTTPVPRRAFHTAATSNDPPSVGAIARQGQAIKDMIAAVVQPRTASSSSSAAATIPLEAVPPNPRPTDTLVAPAPLRRSASVTSTTGGGNDDLFERRQRDARKNVGIDLSNQSSSSPPELRPVVAADLSRPLAARLARSTSVKTSDSTQSIASLAKEPMVTAAPQASASTKPQPPPATKPRPLPAPPVAASGSTLTRRPSVNPLDSFNRLGRSQSLKSRPTSSLVASGKKSEELLKPTRSFGPAQKSAAVVPAPPPTVAAKARPVVGNAASRMGQQTSAKTNPKPALPPTTVPASTAVVPRNADAPEPEVDRRAQPAAPSVDRPAERPREAPAPVALAEASVRPVPADLSITSQAVAAGPSCSTPFRRTDRVPLPPDTIRQSAPRPKRNVARSKGSSSSSGHPSSSSPRVSKVLDVTEAAPRATIESAPVEKPAPAVHYTAPLDTFVSSAPKVSTLGLGLPPALSKRRTPSVEPMSDVEPDRQVKRKPSVRFTIALAAPEDLPAIGSLPPPSLTSTVKPSTAVPAPTNKSPGKRATSQPTLTVPKTFSFAAARSASTGAGGLEGLKPSSREMAAIKAEEKLKAKRDGGPTIGSGGGWGRPSAVVRPAPPSEEEARSNKRVRSEAEAKPVQRRTTSGGTGLYGIRPRLPSEHMRRPDSEGHEDDTEVSALLCPPATSSSSSQKQPHLEPPPKQVPRKVSATHHPGQQKAAKVSSSTTAKLSDAKRVVSAGSTGVLISRKASAEVKRHASGERATTTTTTGITRSLSSVNFQKRLSQWREAESRRPVAAPAPRPSMAVGGPRPSVQPTREWADVSLVHHVLPVKAPQADPRPDFGFATDKRRRERELFEAERQAREQAEMERKLAEDEARARAEAEEDRRMRRLKVPMANPVPEWYRSS